MALTVLACYDIADDDRRSKVAARLQRYGDRIQYSVFLCSITPEDFRDLLNEISCIIDPGEDSFFAVRQCSACWAEHITIGQTRPLEPVLYWATF